jgi:hypothetical protein
LGRLDFRVHLWAKGCRSGLGKSAKFFLLTSLTMWAVGAAQQTRTPAKVAEENDASVRADMRNVKYRFTDNVAVHIKTLRGALVPIGDHEYPVLDDKDSYHIRIDAAEIAINPVDLSNVLNSYVFARPHAPLAGISIAIVKDKLKLKGNLHDRGNIPFETIGTLSATPDGKVRLHSEKIKALQVPVKGLMEVFGVDVSDLIKTGKVSGVTAERDDLILDLGQIMPPPHLEGKVTAIQVQAETIVQTFGNGREKSAEKRPAENYMWFRGNRLGFGKVTMTDADLLLLDSDPGDPLDFYLDHWQEQLAAGYTKITVQSQFRSFLKDYDKLSGPKSASNKQSK